MKKKSIIISSLLTIGLFTASGALAASNCPPTSQAFTCPQVSYSTVSQPSAQVVSYSAPKAASTQSTRKVISTQSATGNGSNCNTSAGSNNCNIIYGANYSSLYGTSYDCNTSSSCGTSTSSGTSYITFSAPKTTYSSSCGTGNTLPYYSYTFNCR